MGISLQKFSQSSKINFWLRLRGPGVGTWDASSGLEGAFDVASSREGASDAALSRRRGACPWKVSAGAASMWEGAFDGELSREGVSGGAYDVEEGSGGACDVAPVGCEGASKVRSGAEKAPLSIPTSSPCT